MSRNWFFQYIYVLVTYFYINKCFKTFYDSVFMNNTWYIFEGKNKCVTETSSAFWKSFRFTVWWLLQVYTIRQYEFIVICYIDDTQCAKCKCAMIMHINKIIAFSHGCFRNYTFGTKRKYNGLTYKIGVNLSKYIYPIHVHFSNIA